MCLFKKKQNKEIPNAKYKIGDLVKVNYHHDVRIGKIAYISNDKNDEITYSIQLGGECPSYISNILEKDIFL